MKQVFQNRFRNQNFNRGNEIILEDPKTRIEKARKWLELQEKRDNSDSTTRAKRNFQIREALASLKQQRKTCKEL
ncbi:hypothetical protein GF386_04300 [Candidatus Pacearchaeota archaeon]|nr:hypothetical protein [Candidatus Pacearchaeota archaeon]MBD3283346.1 hypothetical protein [Candidatus Pacearchaeota archaeon]